eukprot:scaffold50658_cov63-Phaeocystis_antarctica.AAC.5
MDGGAGGNGGAGGCGGDGGEFGGICLGGCAGYGCFAACTEVEAMARPNITARTDIGSPRPTRRRTAGEWSWPLQLQT